MDRWDPRHINQTSPLPSGRSDAAEDFGVPLKIPKFGFWKVWTLLNVSYLALGFWLIATLRVVNPDSLGLHSPVILLLGILLLGSFVGGYALLVYGTYRAWQWGTRATRP